MTVLSYILVSLSFGLNTMLLFRSCAEASPIRLTRALVETFFVALVHVVFFVAGQHVGMSLRFVDAQDADLYHQTNDLVYMGLMIVVSIRWVVAAFRREEPAYRIDRWSTVAALAVATGSSPLFVGIADGFLGMMHSWWTVVVPLLLLEFLLGYLGVMMGRRHKHPTPRRWRLLAVVLLLAVALFSVAAS